MLISLVLLTPSSVANKILDMKKHQVSLGAEVSISVEARPVHMLLPKVVEVRRRGCLNFSLSLSLR